MSVLKVTVDHDLCEGHAKCEAAAPEVFKVGDDEISHVLVPMVSEELRPKVEKAIRLCPRGAIAWVQE